MLSSIASLAPPETASYYDAPTTDILPLSSLDYDGLCEIGHYTDVAFRSASSATMATEDIDDACESAFFFGAQEHEEALDPSWVAVWWSGSSSSSLNDVEPHGIAPIVPHGSWYEDDANTLLSSSTLSVGPDSLGRFWTIGDSSESFCDSAPTLAHCDNAWLPEEEWKNAAWLREVHDRRAAQSRPTRAALEAMRASEERKIRELHKLENWPSLSATRA